MKAPDWVLEATSRVLGDLLPLLRRQPGPLADPDLYARYRRKLERLAGDTRAAARSPVLAVDLAEVVTGYRRAASDMRAVVDGLARVVVRSRTVNPAPARSASHGLMLRAELALAGLFEALALGGQAAAVADLTLRSHDDSGRLRAELTASFDLAIERAAERGDVLVMRALREVQGKLARDLIERGRPLARIVGYETAVPLPAVVVAHRLYQDAGRAAELRAENPDTDHPAFMPRIGRAYSR